jgi:serine/threonine protein kinase
MTDKLKIGQTLLHYEIIEKIGEGGMAEIYKGFDKKLKREVAIKIMRPPSGVNHKESSTRFLSEARILAKLNHPSFTTIYEIEEQKNLSFFVMEFLEGQSLKDYATQEYITFGILIDFMISVAEGLMHLHEHEIFHRDIKPSNLFVTNENEIKIIDLGIAKWKDNPMGQQTKSHQIIGSLVYCAPELFDGHRFDEFSEMYCLGMTMVNTVLSHPLFDGRTSKEIVSQIRHRKPKYPDAMEKNLPDSLRQFFQTSLEKEPKDRFKNFEEMIFSLKKLKRELDSEFLKLPIDQIHDDNLEEFLEKSKEEINILSMGIGMDELELQTKGKKRNGIQRNSPKFRGKTTTIVNAKTLKHDSPVVKDRAKFRVMPWALALCVGIIVFNSYKEKFLSPASVAYLNNIELETLITDSLNLINPRKEENIQRKRMKELKFLILKGDDNRLLDKVDETERLMGQWDDKDLNTFFAESYSIEKITQEYKKGKNNNVLNQLSKLNKDLATRLSKSQPSARNTASEVKK